MNIDCGGMVSENERLRAELDQLRGLFEVAEEQARNHAEDSITLQREVKALRERAQKAEAEADELRRQLLDETYRPEGGEIVMRELSNVKAERDEARRLAQSNADTARDYHEAILDAHAERDTLAARLAAVREIHRPEFDPGRRGRQVCSECLGYTSPVPSRIGYPCQTVRALDVPLGTPEGETAKTGGLVAVEFYKVVCNACGTDTAGLGHDYAAWSDKSQAQDDWENNDGVVLADGRAYCDGCLPPDVCLSNEDHHRHNPIDGECEFCGSPVGSPEGETAR